MLVRDDRFIRPDFIQDGALFVQGRADVDAQGARTAAVVSNPSPPPWRSIAVYLPSGSGAGAGADETITPAYTPPNFPAIDFLAQSYRPPLAVNPLKLPRPPFTQDPVLTRAVDLTGQIGVASRFFSQSFLPPVRPRLDTRLLKGHDDAWITSAATVTVANSTQWASTEFSLRSYRPPARPSLVVPVHLSFQDDASWIAPAAAAFSAAASAFAGPDAFTDAYLMPSRTRLLDGRHLTWRDDTAWLFSIAQSSVTDPGVFVPAESMLRLPQPWHPTSILINGGSGAGAGGVESANVWDPSIQGGLFDTSLPFMTPRGRRYDPRWESWRGFGYALDVAPPIGIASAGDLFPSSRMAPGRRLTNAHLSFVDRGAEIFFASFLQLQAAQFMVAAEAQRQSYRVGKRPVYHPGVLENFSVDWIVASFPIAFNQAWTPAMLFQSQAYRVPGRRYTRPIITLFDDAAWIFKTLPANPVLPTGHKHRWPQYVRMLRAMGRLP